LPSIREILVAGGPLSQALGDGFEPRPQQLSMASAVESALEDRATLMVEAGTGVGKSFAYLAPAMRRAMEFGERVVIATSTIALQEQLVGKDVPLLQNVMSAVSAERGWMAPLRAVLVKGRGNYVSIRRLQLASSRRDLLMRDEESRLSLRQIEDWAYETDDGTLSTLAPLERPEVWEHVRSDTDNCMGRKCPHHDGCFYQRARKAAESANLIITNHALLLADLAMRGAADGGAGVLPGYQHVIIDEAHALEDMAHEAFGMRLTQGRVGHLLRTLYDAKRRKGYLAQLAMSVKGDDHSALVSQAIEAAMQAGHASRAFFDALLELRPAGHPFGSQRLYIPPAEMEGFEDGLTPQLSRLALRLKAIRETLERDEDRLELNAYCRRAAELADTAKALVHHDDRTSVHWLEVDRGRVGPRVTLASAPVEVRDILAQKLFAKEMGIVLTSATLATRASREDDLPEHAEAVFAHAMRRLGCEDSRTLQLGSPFDHASQVRLFVDRSMPSPTGSEGSGYIRALTERVLDHASATDGGVFVLLTSYATLRALASSLVEPLESLGMPLLVHGGDTPRSQLLERFGASGRAVLLGADSFWMGVDVRGDALRNVIITKLPFEPPDRPLAEARAELIRARGGDPFREDSLPRAIIKFKQGFGRLVRSASDTGRVVVLDPRLATKPYGRMFMRALPEGVEPELLEE